MTRIFTLALLFAINWVQAEPIWSNKSQGGDDYLVGTIHLGDQRFEQLPDRIKQAIDAVDVIVLELDLNAISPAQQQRLTLQYGLLPGNKTLSSELSPKIYRQAKHYLAELGYDIVQFEKMKPWMFGLTMVQLSYANLGLDGDKGTDKLIQAYALEKGKQVVGLETFEQQLQFFDRILAANTDMTSDDLIIDTLSELVRYKHLPRQMLNAWLQGNMNQLEHIYQLTLTESKFDLYAEKVLLTDRNLAWQKKLAPMLKNKKVMVAVGSLHFVGPKSLLKLMNGQFTQL